MASIMKRGDSYSVRYKYKDHSGKPCEGWESFKTKKEAQERKITVEKELLDGTFLVPDTMTVEEMLYKWIPIQSTKHKWSPKTYTQSVAMVQNLIVPYIGKRKVQELRTYDIEKFYAILAKTPCGQYVHGVKQKLSEKQKKRLLLPLMLLPLNNGLTWFNRWWSPWHCHSCVGRRPDISAELAGGGILWLCGGLASAFTVARRAGADVVGRARGTADRLSLSHSQRCHLQPHAARTSRPGTRHGLGGDAVSLAHGYACGRRVCRPCWSAPWPRCIGRVCGARGSTLAPSSICYNGGGSHSLRPNPYRR